MPTLKANHRVIASAPPLGGKRTRYRIEGVDGLWLDVGPRGNRVWYVRYQPGSRTTRNFRFYRIGNIEQIGLADATKRAKEIIGEVHGKERDPQAERVEKNKQGKTFGDLFEDWFERHAEPTLARAPTDRIRYRTHIEPDFAKKRLKDIKRVDIGKFRDKIAKDASPLTSNAVIDLIGRVFNWAVDEGMMEMNPAARMRKIGEAKPRERILTQTDIPKFWQALDDMETMTGEHMARAETGRMLSSSTRSVLRLLLLTAQRRGEVVGARKSELELDGSEPVWTIPGERTKNGLLHRMPLCPLARAEFEKAVKASPEDSPFVFPSAAKPKEETITALSITRAMARLVRQLKIADVSPHDLRRTVGTQLARLGIPLHVRSLVLNHSPQSRGVTDAVYNRYAYDKEKREALLLWEHELVNLIVRKATPETIAA